MHYIIVKEKDLEKLSKTVNEYLSKGYIPTGGISTITERIRIKTKEVPTGEWDTSTYYIQSMINTKGTG